MFNIIFSVGIVFLCILMGIIIVSMYQLFSASKELVIKFIEQNQTYYKTQKYLVDKMSADLLELKKILSVNNELKRIVSNLQESSKTISDKVQINKNI